MNVFDISHATTSPRILLLGEAKAGKTSFLVGLAKKNYNIIVLDGDKGGNSVKKQVKPKDTWQGNFLWLDLSDKVYKGKKISYVQELEKIFNINRSYKYNRTKNIPFGLHDEDDDVIIEFDVNNLSKDTFVVLDSWTAVAASIAQEIPVDSITSSRGSVDKLGAYGAWKHKADELHKNFINLKTPLVTIAHCGYKDLMKEKDGTVTKGIIQPISTTSVHSGTLSKYYTDLFFLESEGDKKLFTTTKVMVGSYAVNASSSLLGDVKRKELILDGEVFSKIYEAYGVETQPGFNDKAILIKTKKEL